MIVAVPAATAVTNPEFTVATAVLLEVHVAIVVMGTIPLHVVAFASNCCVLGLLEALRVALVGLSAIDVMHPTVTVSDCVPLIEGVWVEVAVIVAVPSLWEVTRPEVLIVATGALIDHETGVLFELPSLYVPVALIWTVLFVVPVWIVGVRGVTVIAVRVGFTKNPRHPAPSAPTTNTAKASVNGSLRPVNIDIRLE